MYVLDTVGLRAWYERVYGSRKINTYTIFVNMNLYLLMHTHEVYVNSSAVNCARDLSEATDRGSCSNTGLRCGGLHIGQIFFCSKLHADIIHYLDLPPHTRIHFIQIVVII